MLVQHDHGHLEYFGASGGPLLVCKPVGTVGAEYLLLDTHSLKTVLADLPSLVEVKLVGRNAPQDFIKVIMKGNIEKCAAHRI